MPMPLSINRIMYYTYIVTRGKSISTHGQPIIALRDQCETPSPLGLKMQFPSSCQSRRLWNVMQSLLIIHPPPSRNYPMSRDRRYEPGPIRSLICRQPSLNPVLVLCCKVTCIYRKYISRLSSIEPNTRPLFLASRAPQGCVAKYNQV